MLEKLDSLTATLIVGLKQRLGDCFNIVIVSDHGKIFTKDRIKLSDFVMVLGCHEGQNYSPWSWSRARSQAFHQTVSISFFVNYRCLQDYDLSHIVDHSLNQAQVKLGPGLPPAKFDRNWLWF